ncbi:uncharacterized protein DS421_7g222010 [Arachis hypogaea]|nr:uncharacterized protein DS421_7g222010 [Arachis hypogaea]
MRGGFVRGGASRSHTPRNTPREDEETSKRELKKSKTATQGEEFSGKEAIAVRVEDWMMDDTRNLMEKPTIHELAAVEEIDTSKIGTKKISFASMVNKGNQASQEREASQEHKEGETVMQDDMEANESDDESDILIKKLPNGLYNLVISEGVQRELRKYWWETIIVKLLGRKISLITLKRRLEAMWGKMGSIDVIDLGNDFFLVKFHNSSDLDYALMEGPWKVLDHYLTIRLWQPDFNPTTTAIDKIAVWIRLPDLPIEYYHRAILQKIGGIVGRTIKVDTNTAEITREKFARLCVEVELDKPLVS